MSVSALLLAVGAGLLSFLSPCVLPLIPGYLGFITGVSVEQLKNHDAQARRRHVIVSALLFCAGFLLVFVALGATASSLGLILLQHRLVLSQIGGVVLVILGLQLAGILKLPWLAHDYRNWLVPQRFHKARAFLTGIFFAFGWTPCLGPILGSILLAASLTESLGRGSVLLLAYGLGIALPFFAVAVGFGFWSARWRTITRWSRVAQYIAAAFLILFGVFLLLGKLSSLTSWLYELYQAVGLATLVQ